MEYFRIVKREYADQPLGYGAAAGRWNPRQVPMIYASSSVALTVTEYLSIKGPQVVTTHWSLITYELLSDAPILEKDGLPQSWDARPYSLSTQFFGQSWAMRRAGVALKVPSARLPLSAYPREHNLLINPLHPDFSAKVVVSRVEE
ncbi:MAG: RES family NAD+ phosphorylase, partial [Cyclobacteriaceae bacterium]|nr:RES family NAD+ phosphorylase [Cyclobacteriaceae bacterium]